jgi:hypothetical protein
MREMRPSSYVRALVAWYETASQLPAFTRAEVHKTLGLNPQPPFGGFHHSLDLSMARRLSCLFTAICLAKGAFKSTIVTLLLVLVLMMVFWFWTAPWADINTNELLRKV